MPNILVGTINASAPSNTLVGTNSAEVVATNNNRAGLVLVNISDSTIYLALMGFTATLNTGIALTPKGGAFTMDEYNFNKSAVNAIAHSAGNILTIQEFIL